MRRFVFALACIGFGAGLISFAFHFHVVSSEGGWLVVGKQQTDLADCLVDVRGWGPDEWKSHSDLAMDLVAAGHGDVVRSTISEAVVRDLLKNLKNPKR